MATNIKYPILNVARPQLVTIKRVNLHERAQRDTFFAKIDLGSEKEISAAEAQFAANVATRVQKIHKATRNECQAALIKSADQEKTAHERVWKARPDQEKARILTLRAALIQELENSEIEEDQPTVSPRVPNTVVQQPKTVSLLPRSASFKTKPALIEKETGKLQTKEAVTSVKAISVAWKILGTFLKGLLILLALLVLVAVIAALVL